MARRGHRPALRLVALFGVFTLAFLAVGGRLVQLQIVQAAPLQDLGEQQRVRSIELPAKRGPILDRELVPLAVSTEARALFANPRLLARDGIDLGMVAERVAPLLGKPRATIRDLLSTDSGFVYLARRVPPQVAESVLALRLPYLDTLKETMRTYPADDAGGQILGFVNVDNLGLSGIESAYDRVLRGIPGAQTIERDPRGRAIPQGERSIVEPEPGSGVVLTIDRDLQFLAEQALARGVGTTRATRGTAVVLDTRTGEVLAMANHPPLNPNRFGDAPADQRRNRVVADVYEPGSVLKVITAAAATDLGIAAPSTDLTVPYSIGVGGRTFRDFEYHPTWRINYAEALARSSNVGTIKIALRVGEHKLYKTMRRFGIGRVTGVGYPGEAAGLLLPPNEWYGTSIATIPIGQGVAVTPLQLASVYATVANDGVRIPPRLVRGTVDWDGAFVPADPPEATRVISAFAAAQVRGMLLGVVEGGTGTRVQIPGVLVGGKTGTARVPRPDARGYSNRIITSFAGIAPVDDPRLAILVQLEDPKPRLAALTAAPVFREIMMAALAHLGVPLSDPRVARTAVVTPAARAPDRPAGTAGRP